MSRIIKGGTNMLTRQQYSDNAPDAVPVTIDTTSGGTVIAASNSNRLSITLQNVGTTPCLIRLKGNPSATAYNIILGADSAAKAGNGGSVTIRDFIGEIKGITESSSTVIAVMEVE